MPDTNYPRNGYDADPEHFGEKLGKIAWLIESGTCNTFKMESTETVEAEELARLEVSFEVSIPEGHEDITDLIQYTE